MSVRQAHAGDAAAIAAIANAIIADTLITFTTEPRAAAGIAAQIAARGAGFVVAEEAGEITGFATYGRFRPGPGYARTAELTVQLEPRARGKGLGRALVTALESAARGAGIHVLVAAISGANPGAVAFHRALGFAEVGRMPEVGRKQGRWLDLVLMQKILSAGAKAAPDTGNTTG